MQIQEAFVVSGTPLAFPITADGCAGEVIYPGSSCQFTMEFEPTTPGFGEGATLIIIGNTPGPVTPIGFTGTGVSSPAGRNHDHRQPGRGQQIDLQAGWLLRVPPATPTSGCRTGERCAAPRPRPSRPAPATSAPSSRVELTATNPVGEQTVTSPPSAPVAAMDLSRLSGSFVDEGACRTIAVTRRLLGGRDLVTLSYPQPSLPWAPLTVSSPHRLSARIDGRTVGAGRRVTISPGTLAALRRRRAHAQHHDPAVTAPGRRLVLAPCMLAVRVNGGPPTQGALVALASRNAISAATITLPPGSAPQRRLRLARPAQLPAGRLPRARLRHRRRTHQSGTM